MSLLQQLKEHNIITDKGQINKQARRILERNTQLQQTLYQQTSFLEDNGSHDIRARIYCIINDINTQPRCSNCGTPVKFNPQKKRFNNFCPNTNGQSCSMDNSSVREQISKTNEQRYGTTNPLANKNIREKIKQTNFKKYGGPAPINDDTIKQKMQQTVYDRYQTTNISLLPETINKRKLTNLEKYGAFTPAQATKMSSDENYLFDLSYDKDWLYYQHHTLQKSVTQIAQLLSLSSSTLCKRFKTLGIEISDRQYTSSISKQETQFVTLLSTLIDQQTEIITNTKSVIPPYELDIYIPRYNLAFEFCGVYWHSELNGKHKQYHRNKTILCEQQNIRLIQIWSSEWNNNYNLVQSRLANLFGCNTETFYARQCFVEQATNEHSKTFYQANHMQGPCNGKYHLALRDDKTQQIVAMMSFGKVRYRNSNNDGAYELLRFASRQNASVVGGGSKLLKYFIDTVKPYKIVSYCDKRWNTGTMYQKLGFEYSHTSAPNYFYFATNGNTNELFSRISFQKHKLPQKLTYFDPNLTEWENMQVNGYDRIWDCGNDVYVWNSS